MNGQNWLSKLSFWVVKKGSKIGVKTQVGRMSFCTVNRQMVPTSGSNFGLQLLAPTLGSNFGRCFWSIFWPILNPILESHFVCNSGIVLDCTHPVDAKHCKGQHAVRPIDESMLSKGLPQSSRVCNDHIVSWKRVHEWQVLVVFAEVGDLEDYPVFLFVMMLQVFTKYSLFKHLFDVSC